MTPAQIHAALKEIAAPFGPKADASAVVRISRWGEYASAECALWPDGIGGSSRRIAVEAPSFAEGLDKLRAAIAEEMASLEAAAVHKMAMCILESADDHGRVSEAALRMVASPAEIARLGTRAVERANTLAGRGPFSIATVAGANAPAEAEV